MSTPELTATPWYLSEWFWLAIGFLGQAMFTMRFVVQWLASEKEKRSVMPVAFWYFSLFGGWMLLAYAIYRRDPVIITGQAFGCLVYVRNLHLIQRSKFTRDENPPNVAPAPPIRLAA